MGKSRWKIDEDIFQQSMTFPQGIELNFQDPNRIGDVYVVVFKKGQINRETAHHAVLVDVAGSSDDNFFEGVLLHLTANIITQIVKLRVEDNSWTHDDFYEAVHIGRLVPTQAKPRRWAHVLHGKALDLYFDFTDQDKNIKWTSSVNCQTYARALVNELGLVWPTQLPYANDECLPIIIDITIQVMSMKALKEKKYEEACKKKENKQQQS